MKHNVDLVSCPWRAPLEQSAPGCAIGDAVLAAWQRLRESRSPSEYLPSLVLVDGQASGFLRSTPVEHPGGLSGKCIEIEISPASFFGTLTSHFPAIIEALESRLRTVLGIDTVLVRAAELPTAFTSTLAELGFQRHEASFIRELTSPLWRKGGVTVIAEAGSNWRMGTPSRDMAMAKALIEVAREAGADIVKFQTFRPDALYAPNAGSSDYLAEAGISQTMEEIFADITMPHDMLPELARYAREIGIGFMSTAFSAEDFAAVDPLVDMHKIASYEVSHIRLIELAARSGKPTVMSTGAATLDDIEWAVGHFHASGGKDLCLLQCTAKYPAPFASLNLATIPELARMFGVSAGLSDHSRDAIIGPVAATALGARVIEKHYTLHNRLPGPDHAFAITGEELKQMVTGIRAAEQARGTGIKVVHSVENELALFAQRGLQAIRPIAVGDVLSEDGNFAILRPGKQSKGVHPRHIASVQNSVAQRNMRPGEGILNGDWEPAARGK